MKRVNFLRMVFMVLFSVLSLGIAPLGLEAFQIEYQFTGTGEVIVAGTEYENANFLISLFGDTEDVVTETDIGSSIYGLIGNIEIFNADGNLFSGEIISPTLGLFTSIFLDDRNWDLLALETSGSSLFGFFYPNIGSYTLGTLSESILAADSFSIFNSFNTQTEFGQLTFTEVESASFQAPEVAQSVPEPASLILLGSGLLALAGLGRRIRK
ncbi:MAG: PEP-CTERM sorting domain-containing protein [Deltaproteobacteria bacterium]|nr:PEP-CTERM sorting domain-containing protein [Deltaproteobacteria bacterium]